MFRSYFFVPANSKRFLASSEVLVGISHRIFDLEDSVRPEDVTAAVSLLATEVRRRETDLVRVPLGENLAEVVEGVGCAGFRQFVIPKYSGIEVLAEVLEVVLTQFSDARFLLLLENPRAFVELQETLCRFGEFISAVGLGMHDFAFAGKLENNMFLLQGERREIALLARAYGVEPVDVASMNISDPPAFQVELQDAFRCGYRSKFLIHPLQLRALLDFPFYSRDQVQQYERVLSYYQNIVHGRAALFSFEGRAYERMHIAQIEQAVEWGRRFYGTDRSLL